MARLHAELHSPNKFGAVLHLQRKARIWPRYVFAIELQCLGNQPSPEIRLLGKQGDSIRSRTVLERSPKKRLPTKQHICPLRGRIGRDADEVALPRSRTRCPESPAPGFGHFGVDEYP